MDAPAQTLVEILREFLAVDVALRRLVARYRADELSWEEVRDLVTDTEGSPLYRLKERSHTLFRAENGDASDIRHREVLFDLAIGSLFHEAMKFRENFYQREVYGPRVRALRKEAGAEAVALFAEFEKILGTGSVRLEESVIETHALLERCREQLIDLLAQHGANGYVARHLIEQREVAEGVFGRELDAVFGELFGDAASAWAEAGRSYVVSGYFAEGRKALEGAVSRGSDGEEIDAWIAYADGMAAYMRGDYAASVAQLGQWAGRRNGEDLPLVVQASAALSRLRSLVDAAESQALVREADEIVEALGA